MNAARACRIAGVAAVLMAAQTWAQRPASSQPPHRWPAVRAPQPVAPSALPYEVYRYDDDDDPYGIEHARYGDDTRAPCMAHGAAREDPPGTPHGTPESRGPRGARENQGAVATAIDWCALAPYRPRHAPQVPAAWWWHRRSPWRYGGTR